jgi:hypothetical protein
MITDKIKNLFQFIEFLYSNTENFKQYDDVINELYLLKNKRDNISKNSNFKEKLRHDELQSELKEKFDIIDNNIIQVIKSKIIELNICDWGVESNLWNYYITEINNLKENFEQNDIPTIIKYKNQYINFRTNTNCDYFQSFLFSDLDRILKVLFDFFNESDKNEFEAFETKTIQVNSIEEAVKYLTKNKDERFWLNDFFAKKQFTMPDYLAFKSQIDNNGSFVIKLDNDSVNIYTPELAIILTSKLNARNMETQIETVVNGRDYLNTYIEAYKEGEQYFENEFKVTANTLYGLNAEMYVRDIHLNFFHINHSGAHEGWSYVKKNFPLVVTYKVIKDFGYYSGIVSKVEAMVKKYPKQFQTFDICEHNQQPQQIETVKNIEIKKELHNHIFKGNAFEIFEKYHNARNLAENSKTDLNLLFQLFKKDNLFLETVELKHYIQWLNKTYCYSLTELKKVNINSRPNIQRTNDYKQYKETTLNKP